LNTDKPFGGFHFKLSVGEVNKALVGKFEVMVEYFGIYELTLAKGFASHITLAPGFNNMINESLARFQQLQTSPIDSIAIRYH